jgi:outer membrane protein OmpA-like peptidoglycan-associated protein
MISDEINSRGDEMKKLIATMLVLGLAFFVFGCGMSKAQKGALIGAGAGAGAGAAIGKATGNTAAGAVAGTAVGGVAGAFIGKYMDNQAKEVAKEVPGAKVEVVGEGENAKVDITFDSGFLFDFDKSGLKADTKVNLDKFSAILQKYPDTNIVIAGHTDSKGDDSYNMELSKKRANAVSDYLATQSVNRGRMTVNWFGEAKPVASNDTDEGRAQNRRVEIAISANEKLKQEAAKAK